MLVETCQMYWLDKLNACRNYLQQNGVFDIDSFVDFFEEDLL